MTNEDINPAVAQKNAMNPYAQTGLQMGGDIVSSIINNAWAERHARKAYERQVEFWNMQNEYNDPRAVMARLKGSGINPHAFYQKGTYQAQSQSAPSVQQARTFGINPQLAQMVMQVKRLNQDIEESKSRVKLNNANVDNVNERTTKQAIDNFVQSFTYNYHPEGRGARYTAESGKSFSVQQAYKLWLNNEETFPPAIENTFFDRLQRQYDTTSALEKKRILQAESVLKRAGYTWQDDLAVRIGIMIADKDPNIDISTIQGASAVWDIVQKVIPTVGKFAPRSSQRGRTGSQYVERRDVYSRDGKYMGGTRTERKYN